MMAKPHSGIVRSDSRPPNFTPLTHCAPGKSPHGGPPTPLSSDFGSLRSNLFLSFRVFAHRAVPFWVIGFLGAWLIRALPVP